MSGSRSVLVTGGGRGIGRAVALRFAEEGCRIFVGFFVNREAAEKTAAEIYHRGGTPYLLRGDLKDPAEISRMFEEIRGVTGRLDVLVNNAASGVLKPARSLLAKHWDWALNTNSRPLLLLAREATGLMGPGGRIISISSLGSQRVVPQYTAVGVSKAALEALTRYLAVEMAPEGITVNAVSAGAVETEVWRAFPEGAEILSAVRDRTPAGQLTSPEDVAEVVHFLASPEARMIQGQVIVVDGGYSLLA